MVAQSESQHLCQVNDWDVGGKACSLGGFTLVYVENGMGQIAGADDYVGTLMLGLGQNCSRLTKDGRLFLE